MRRLVLALLGVGLLAAACGSDDGSQPTATETSAREARQPTVMEDQEAQSQALAEAEVEQVAAQEPQVEAQQQSSEEQQTVELPADEVGEHKGVRSQRNVLGEPDAPVLIEYYGDFT